MRRVLPQRMRQSITRDWIRTLPSRIPTMNQLMILGVTAVGFLCIIVSSIRTSWFDLPICTFDAAMGWSDITSDKPWITPCFKVVGLVTILLLAWSWWRERSWTRISTTIACGWLLVVLTFPYFVMLGNPEIAARALWLQTQHDHLTWLGGDINTSMEMSRTGWKSHVMIVDAPVQVSVVPLPSWAARQIGLDRLPHLVEWLGYNNAFCQFVRKGWSKAFLGGLMLLIITLFRNGEIVLERAGYAIGVLSVGAFCFALVAWSVPFSASRHIRTASAHTVVGDYDAALLALLRAGNRLPVLHHDTYFVAQRGLLEHRLGHDSPHARLYAATLQEQDGFFEQSLIEYESLTHSNDLAVAREANRALLRDAIHTMNSGSTQQAAEKLQHLLQLEPCNLKAMHILQLAWLRSGDDEKLEKVADHLYATCEHFRFPTKRALLATAQQNLTFAAARNGNAHATWEGVIRSKSPGKRNLND